MTASSQLAYCVVTRDKRQRRACPTKSQLAGRLTTLTAYLQWIPSATLRQGERMRLAAFAAYTRNAQADAVTLPWRRSANQPRSYPAWRQTQDAARQHPSGPRCGGALFPRFTTSLGWRVLNGAKRPGRQALARGQQRLTREATLPAGGKGYTLMSSLAAARFSPP